MNRGNTGSMFLIHCPIEWSCPSSQPQNILLTSACPLGDIKIVDFGLSRRLCQNQELREIMGTPEYVGEWKPLLIVFLLNIQIHFDSNNLMITRLALAKIFTVSLVCSPRDSKLWTNQHSNWHVVRWVKSQPICLWLSDDEGSISFNGNRSFSILCLANQGA